MVELIMGQSKGDIGEEFVNELAYNSYLKYWCYPNPKDINGDKKEICDLLISFRDVLIIISVKNHSFDGNYPRYQKKVVAKSSSQLNGAERKLFNSARPVAIQHPERVPEQFDPRRYSKVYKLTINVGEQFENYELTDQATGKSLINILNKETFEILLQELDTIKDLIEYLDEREKLLTSKHIISMNGTEKDLLAVFLMNARKFPKDFYATQRISLDIDDAWGQYNKSGSTALKRKADRASYFIDDLVKSNVLPMAGGEILARELMNLSRTERRMLANTLFSLVKKYQDESGILARRYSEYNGIGHLLIYYPPDEDEKSVDELLKIAPAIYGHKTNFREKEIIVLAATKDLKQWKFGFYIGSPPLNDATKNFLDKLIAQFGWFTSGEIIYYIEKEYPDERDKS